MFFEGCFQVLIIPLNNVGVLAFNKSTLDTDDVFGLAKSRFGKVQVHYWCPPIQLCDCCVLLHQKPWICLLCVGVILVTSKYNLFAVWLCWWVGNVTCLWCQEKVFKLTAWQNFWMSALATSSLVLARSIIKSPLLASGRFASLLEPSSWGRDPWTFYASTSFFVVCG